LSWIVSFIVSTKTDHNTNNVFLCLFCFLVRSFVRLFVCSFVRSFVRSFVCLFVCLLVVVFLFVCLFVCSFVRSFVCLFVLYCLFSVVSGIHTDSQRKSMTNMRKRILLYVLVFMFCWTPGMLNSNLIKVFNGGRGWAITKKKNPSKKFVQGQGAKKDIRAKAKKVHKYGQQKKKKKKKIVHE